MRAGKQVLHHTGYHAFHPEPLPPANPPLDLTPLIGLLSEADRALGRLDGVTATLPNPDLFVAMYVRQEAVLSSQIEGTQATLVDVLQFEAAGDDGPGAGKLRHVDEVVNYVRAMKHGLTQTELPLSLRLIREIHDRLMHNSRGGNKAPGEFRTTQNWIGAGGSLRDASYVPPPPELLPIVLGDLERFLHDESLPPIIHAGLAHAQFETIHPFLDGNGRVGRLLLTFLLCHRKVLARPLLYLSHHLKKHRAEYYDLLQGIRFEGAWEPWLEFFIRGVRDVATEATNTAMRIIELRQEFEAQLKREGKATPNLLRALDHLFESPIIKVAHIEKHLSVTPPTANNLVSRLTELGLLEETTGFARNRQFSFRPYLNLFESARPL